MKADKEARFKEGLRLLINSLSLEGGSNTQDFLLADYLVECLKNWERTLERREILAGRAFTLNDYPPARLESDSAPKEYVGCHLCGAQSAFDCGCCPPGAY